MLGRLFVSAWLAAIVTIGLFQLMQMLVASSKAKLNDEDFGLVAEFVRIKRSERLQEEKRELPQRPAPEREPSPPQSIVDYTHAANASELPLTPPIQQPPLAPSMHIVGGPHLGTPPSDRDVVPLVRVQPIYPHAAAERELEGWVLIEFTISTTGTVKDPAVVSAEPPNVFERAALRAIRKWKYKPRIEHGKPVETHEVRVQLMFALQDQ